MTPDELAKSGTEHGEQTALFAWAAANVGNDPRLALLFAIPNGGARGNSTKDRAIRGAHMKAEGVRSGVPDVFLPVPAPNNWGSPNNAGQYHGLFIEMKKPATKLKRKAPEHKWDTGGVDPNQIIWLTNLEQQGYKCVVCYSWYEAANEIKFYLTGSDLDGNGRN